MVFKVSVVMPVYNADRFLQRAIESVLIQEEVKELIIVNDGSTDESASVIESFKDTRIKVYEHPESLNKGRSCSRNLAISKATQDYVAFLDADDYYLPQRFLNDAYHFDQFPKSDGIYNAIGATFYREGKQEEIKELELTTVTKKIAPDQLFEELLQGGSGYFSIDGLTVKKSLFDKTGVFIEYLPVAEDTNLILKMALLGSLHAGVVDQPVAMRGVHDQNIFDNAAAYVDSKVLMYEELIQWSLNNQQPNEVISLLLKWLYFFKEKEKQSFFKKQQYWNHLIWIAPKLLGQLQFYKYLPVIRDRKKMTFSSNLKS